MQFGLFVLIVLVLGVFALGAIEVMDIFVEFKPLTVCQHMGYDELVWPKVGEYYCVRYDEPAIIKLDWGE